MAELSEQDMFFGVCMELMRESNGKLPTAKRLAEAAGMDVEDAKEILADMKSGQPKKKPKSAAAKPKAKALSFPEPLANEPPANGAEGQLVASAPSAVQTPVEVVEVPEEATQVHSPDNQLGLPEESFVEPTQVEEAKPTLGGAPLTVAQTGGESELALPSPLDLGRGDSQRPASSCVHLLSPCAIFVCRSIATLLRGQAMTQPKQLQFGDVRSPEQEKCWP